MISNLLSFTAFLHGVLVSYGAFVCVLLKDCPPLFATKVINGIMVPSFFCISKVFVWKCVWPLSLSLFISSSSFFLWFHDTCHLMLFTQYSLLDQFYFCTSCLSIAHFEFTNKIHQLFTDYLFTTTILRAAWNTSVSLSGQPSSSFCIERGRVFYRCQKQMASAKIPNLGVWEVDFHIGHTRQYNQTRHGDHHRCQGLGDGGGSKQRQIKINWLWLWLWLWWWCWWWWRWFFAGWRTVMIWLSKEVGKQYFRVTDDVYLVKGGVRLYTT